MKVKELLAVAFISLISLGSYSALAQSGTNTLSAGQKLLEGQRLVSANKSYYLTVQADGNLCIYTTNNNSFVWCSMIYLGKGSSLSMQTDGNLVVYNGANKAVWNSMTQPWFDSKYATAEWKPVRLVLENDGKLNLYNAANKKVWGNTDQPAPAIASPGFGYTGPVAKKDLKIKLPGSKKAEDITVEVTENGDAIYQGDMNLGNVDDLLNMASAPTPPGAENSFKWPNSTVPYVLPTSHHRRATIQKAIDYLNTHTNICLVPRSKQEDYVEFFNDNKGNRSHVGRAGGKQIIYIQDDDMTVVIHEIMHALGFRHTHCREDRDKYVNIFLNNVEKGKEHNFKKSLDPQSNLGVYDYNSIMHYFSTAFANRKGEITMSRKDGKTGEMGKYDGMSQTDINNIAAVYSACSGKTPKPITSSAASSTIDPCEAKNAVKAYQTTMKPGNRLEEKQKLVSANNRYHFRITSEGNFVIEEVQNLNNCKFKEVYRFPLQNGNNPSKGYFSYNPDGNICMEGKIGGYCATTGIDAIANIIIYKSVLLELTDDGRLRLINGDGQEIWATPLSKSNPTSTNTGTTPTRTTPTTTTTTPPTRTRTPSTTTSRTRTALTTTPAPTKPTISGRTAPDKTPIFDNTPAIPIPNYTPKTGEFENVVTSEAGSRFKATASWILHSENGASANGPQQVIDGKRTGNRDACKSGEAHTPGWEVNLGRVVYVEYIQIWNSEDPSSLQGRSFYITYGTRGLPKRGNIAGGDPVTGLPYLWEKDKGMNDGIGSYNEPIGPFKWETGQKSMIIPIKKNIKMLNIKLQKDGAELTPITLEEVEIYGKEISNIRTR